MSNLPRFYDPARIGTLYYPAVAEIAADALGANLPPSSNDRKRVHLLIIDMQVDFCHEQGTLFVPGAKEDIRRLVEFIYRNSERITSITCSLDSHLPFQIFHPTWWVNEKGEHPDPFTVITQHDLSAGIWRPTIMPAWSTSYLKQLEEAAKKALVIWPFHVPIGGIGNALDPVVWSAVFWHSLARKSQPVWWTKGSIAQTEHYSIIQPEIPVQEHPQGRKSKALMDTLESYDMIFIAGEAESHCVLETVEDLVEAFGDTPEILGRLHILQDCMSPVIHPEVDFHALALAQFDDYRKKGVNFINSTDPLLF